MLKEFSRFFFFLCSCRQQILVVWIILFHLLHFIEACWLYCYLALSSFEGLWTIESTLPAWYNRSNIKPLDFYVTDTSWKKLSVLSTPEVTLRSTWQDQISWTTTYPNMRKRSMIFIGLFKALIMEWSPRALVYFPCEGTRWNLK